MPINVTKGDIYESYSMLHPDGTLMCHCNEKRALWYINKKLANWVEDKVFKLNFNPQGHGKSKNPYYTQNMENRCVVCGCTNNLNKHHVVPYVFRSRFPVEFKESNHHDILPTCVDCHEKYEGFATKFKEKLANAVGTSMNISSQCPIQLNNKKILSARNLIEKIKNGEIKDNNGKVLSLPEERINYLKKKSQEPLLKENIVSGSIWADKIMENVFEQDKLFDFIKSWRQHFIEYANPQYLPDFWSVDHPLEASNRSKKMIQERSIIC